MKKISYPKCSQSGMHFVISTNEDRTEKLRFLSADFPIAMYTQRFDHAASDQIPFHWHRELQVTWVYRGSLAYQVNGEALTVDRGSLLFINSGLLHSVRTVGGDAETLCINFGPGVFHPMLLKHYIGPVLENPACTCLRLHLKPGYLGALERFADNWDERQLGYFTVTNFLSQLAEDLVTGFTGGSAPVDQREARQFNAILEYLQDRYAQPLTVAQLAREAHVNKNRLTALFKKYTGLSPMKYLSEYRLYAAKRLIADTELSISQISQEVGYNQISHFIQQFRRSFGVTPLKYRARLLSAPAEGGVRGGPEP